MRTHLLALGGALLIAAVLVVVFSLSRTFVAPVVFLELSRANSPLPLVAYALFAPIVIALPFGAAFGVLPWRRTLMLATFVGFIVGGLVVVEAAWLAATRGYSLNWITPAQGLLFTILFAAVAYYSGRFSLRVPILTRQILGSVTFVTFVVLAGASVLWSYNQIVASGRAA